MSTPEANDLSTEEVQEAENQTVQEEAGQEEMEQDAEEENESAGDVEVQPVVGAKRKRERKDLVALVRDEGKSLLPFARVQKIIKADKVRMLCSLIHSLRADPTLCIS
jgi:hypothetical protein